MIGPSGFGLIGDAAEVLHFAEIGVVLLLFLIGLELEPHRLWVMRRAVFGLGSLQVAVTALLLAAGMRFILGVEIEPALLLGFALALSSTAFVLQLLGERKELNQPHGRAAFGVLLFQDVAVIPAIAVLTLMAPVAAGSARAAGPSPITFIALFGCLVAARYLLRPVLGFVAETGLRELFVASSPALVIGAGLAMHAVGLSMGLGAFIAGMMVADSEYRHQLETDVIPFKGLLLGLFFIAVGMSTNLKLLVEAPLVLAGLAVAVVVAKIGTIFLLARRHGLDAKASLRTGIFLSQGGEFAFVLLAAGSAAQVVGPELVERAVLIVTISMATTPLLVAGADRFLADRTDHRPFDEIDEPENPVVIAGFGRFGQIVGRVLSARHVPFTALEVNPVQVDFVRQFGNEIYYGDAKRVDLLRTAKADRARAFVIAVDDVDASLEVAARVRKSFPDLRILARARNRHREIRLRELGVHYTIRGTLHSILAQTENLLTQLGLSKDEALEAVQLFTAHDSRTLERQAAVFHDEVG